MEEETFYGKSVEDLVVCISKGNMKMGAIASVSFPPIVTCAVCECHKKCYAVKIQKYSKQAKLSYERNWFIYRHDKVKFWREVSAAVQMNRTFRWFVSGDIPDIGFMVSMCQVMAENPHCDAICFTKKWAIVNQYLDEGGVIPPNLHLMLSAWRNFHMENPYQLPECHVMFKDGFTTARDGAVYCSGNCTECFIKEKGCFNLKKGEQILIKEH